MKETLRRAAVVTGLSAGFLAGAVQQAEAAPCPRSESGAKLTAKEQKRSNLAQRETNKLARLIVRNLADRKGSYQEFGGDKGRKYGMLGVTLAAGPDRASESSGNYSFEVIAPLSEAGNMRLNCTQSVVIEQNTRKNPLTSLSFFRNLYTGGNEFYGNYHIASTQDAKTNQASTVTMRKDEAHLTENRIYAAVEQATDLIVNADIGAPVEDFDPAFQQPANSRIYRPK